MIQIERYDGPDVESEASAKAQGWATTAVMGIEGTIVGFGFGRDRGQGVAASAQSQRLDAITAADRATWSVLGDDDVLEVMDSEHLALCWQAAARHPNDPGAVAAMRTAERVLHDHPDGTGRDLIVDYRGWRACGYQPGEAMTMALARHDERLDITVEPLLDADWVAQADDFDLLGLWAAAEASRTPMHAEAAHQVGGGVTADEDANAVSGRADRVLAARAAAEAEVRRRGGWPAQELQELLARGATRAEAASLVSADAGIAVPGADFAGRAWDPVARGEIGDIAAEPVTVAVRAAGRSPAPTSPTATALMLAQMRAAGRSV